MIAQAEVKGGRSQVSGDRCQVLGDRCQGTDVSGQESLNSYLLTLTSSEELLVTVKQLKQEGKEIQEVYTPFYVHGLAEALGLKRTRLGKATFLYGLIGLFFGCWLTYFTMIKDWPMDIGGKPNATFWQNLPAFVPVIFELVVYFAAHLLVISFFIRSRLYPFKKAENPIKKSSDDKFVIQVRDKK